jgi:hypothetical protein
LNSVLEQINELGYPGDSILKLQSQEPPFTGVIVIRDGRQVIGARLQGLKQKVGYEALRRLISMADGEFQYFTIKREDYSLPDTLFRLNLNYILSLYPNLPESPADLEDENAIHELVFAVESTTRTDWGQVTPVDNLLNKLDQKDTDWRPMSSHTPESTPSADFVSRDELLDALAKEAANRGNTTAQQTVLQRLAKRLFRSTASTMMVIVFLAAMMTMGYEIVKTTIKNLSGNRIHQRKRRLLKKSPKPQTSQPVESSNKVSVDSVDACILISRLET